MKKLYRTFKILFCALLAFVLLPSPCARAAGAPEGVYFFGDSTTAHMAVRGGVPAERVWSGEGSTVRFSSVNRERCVRLASGELVTLREAAARVKPAVLVITLGVSGGAGVMEKADFQRVYREMLLSVREASPRTKIYVQSILPLSDKSVNYYKKITKDAVAEANGWIREVCAALSVPYIDTHSLLTDGNGYLKKEYQNDEYMHLTSRAYEVILENIRKFIK
ncbi:MAG: SGNH/GDSL hydrolase family protein [Clostridia bacterium]|nr:SGNH/GDSL hydrolase family protein [Clostridia bacterium]